jgi:hypothetical protein
LFLEGSGRLPGRPGAFEMIKKINGTVYQMLGELGAVWEQLLMPRTELY